MRTLRTSALHRVAEGETTLQELERVVGEQQDGVPVPAPVASASPPVPAAPAGPRVLVVEDDTVCRKVAKRLLVESGYEVIEAVSGEEALLKLDSDGDIALAVLDLGLPNMQGDEVLRKMRGSPQLRASRSWC